MNREIERRFLVPVVPDLHSYESKRILQGYITSGGDNEVRVRQIGATYFITVKSGAGIERDEVEVELHPEQFELLWELTAGRRLEKTRFYLPIAPRIVELDVYDLDLSSLIIAEVEFPTLHSSRNFLPPSWFGRDVSDDLSYKNSRLALYGLPPET